MCIGLFHQSSCSALSLSLSVSFSFRWTVSMLSIVVNCVPVPFEMNVNYWNEFGMLAENRNGLIFSRNFNYKLKFCFETLMTGYEHYWFNVDFEINYNWFNKLKLKSIFSVFDADDFSTEIGSCTIEMVLSKYQIPPGTVMFHWIGQRILIRRLYWDLISQRSIDNRLYSGMSFCWVA